jgi:transcriptional regulator GlxA family with amidase domain
MRAERPTERPRRRVVFVVFDGIQSLDLTGPLEVFAAADRVSASTGYATEVVSADGEAIRTSSGITLAPDRAGRNCRGPIDTLVVAGGHGVAEAEGDDRLIAFLRSAANRSRRITSVCTGAFLLARAGLLDGRTATTHWASCARLASRYPEIQVQADRIFVRDAETWTSAGVTAGIDLALALVEEDIGRGPALDVARWLVMFSKRPGGQAQFSSSLGLQRSGAGALRDVQDWIVANPDSNLTVEALADRAGMSVRTFARTFRREIGLTPGSYVEAARIDRARLALESTDAPIDEIARSCGFGTPETMRRAFARRLRVAPHDYRERFGSPATEALREGATH